MRGTAEAQGLFWDTDVLCEELIEEEGFLATLRRARSTVFTDSDFDRLYPSGRGRPSHPPPVLAALLLAQLFYGVSDREAERRSRLDLSWKAALGLPLNHRGIPHVCLAEFRARLLRAGMEGFLHETLLQLATPGRSGGHSAGRRLHGHPRLRGDPGHGDPSPLRPATVPSPLGGDRPEGRPAPQEAAGPRRLRRFGQAPDPVV